MKGGVVLRGVGLTVVGREEVWESLWREGLVGGVDRKWGRSQRLHHLFEPEISLSENRRF